MGDVMIDMTVTAPRAAASGGVRPDDRIGFPVPKRVFVHAMVGETGAREMHLFAGDKQVVFDEPELFAFAERLGRSGAFRAGDAAGWSDQPFERLQPLFDELLQSGVLVRDPEPQPVPADRGRASPLPPAVDTAALSWSRDCEAITARLAGGPIETGHLELFVPVFRVAHPTVDRDGRQVGEANVFPRALRLDVPTDWMVCTYPGSRHLSDRPMNHTALAAMRRHWPDMMAALAVLRGRYLERFGRPRGGWTVGAVERLATMVLAAVTLPLVRAADPVASGDLHPVLASIFRVTDGLRMATHQMMMVQGIEPLRHPSSVVTAAEIQAFAERNYAFHSETGVCAGPRILVAEFLATLLDGAFDDTSRDHVFPAEVAAALADADAAFDYGLHGLRVHAAAFRFWPAMAEAYVDLAAAVRRSAGRSAPLATLGNRLADVLRALETASHLGTDDLRKARIEVYVTLYRETGLALGDADVVLDEALGVEGSDVGLEAAIAARLAARFGVAPRALAEVAAVVGRAARVAQAVVRVSGEAQAALNRAIGRPQPRRPLRIADLDAHNRLQGVAARIPFLFDFIAAETGLAIDVDATEIRLGPSSGEAPATTHPSREMRPDHHPVPGGQP